MHARNKSLKSPLKFACFISLSFEIKRTLGKKIKNQQLSTNQSFLIIYF